MRGWAYLKKLGCWSCQWWTRWLTVYTAVHSESFISIGVFKVAGDYGADEGEFVWNDSHKQVIVVNGTVEVFSEDTVCPKSIVEDEKGEWLAPIPEVGQGLAGSVMS